MNGKWLVLVDILIDEPADFSILDILWLVFAAK